MKKYNNPRLSGAVVAGTGLDHPVRPHVIVGETSMGYVRGDVMDANAIEEIHVELDNKIKEEAKTRKSEDKKIQDQIDFLLSSDSADTTINTLKEVWTFLKDYPDTTNLLSVINGLQSKITILEKTVSTLEAGQGTTIKDATYDKNSNTLQLVFSGENEDKKFVIDLSDVLDVNDLTAMPESQIQNITDNMTVE